jgi:ASC-1-like (ASCH) protein
LALSLRASHSALASSARPLATMRVKQRYLDYIKAGTKPLEVRVGYDSVKTHRAGERIRFASRDDSQVVLVRDVRTYNAVDEMAKVEDLGHIVPGHSRPEVLKTLKAIYPADKERLGVIVLNVEPA